MPTETPAATASADTPAADAFIHPVLDDYARLLHERGFTVRVPARHPRSHYFLYSRTDAGGAERFGIASLDAHYRLDLALGDDPIEHSMPIRPSREHGSSMGVPGALGATLEAAHAMARAANTNPWVGTHANDMSPERLGRYQVLWPETT